jgi:hypothetical protein
MSKLVILDFPGFPYMLSTNSILYYWFYNEESIFRILTVVGVLTQYNRKRNVFEINWKRNLPN